jgi:hypothetical protein
MLLLLASISCIAADLNGVWTLNSKDGDGNPVKSELTIRDQSGTLKSKDGNREIKSMKLQGNSVSFEVPWGDGIILVELEATGDTIKGVWKAGDDQGPINGTRATAATLTGLWKLSAERPNGSKTNLDLEIKSETVAVLRTTEGQAIPLEQVAVSADQISFIVALPQGNIKLQLKLDGGALKGTWATPDSVTGPVEGRR